VSAEKQPKTACTGLPGIRFLGASLRAREQLRQGASQIKRMAGGGIASPNNPIESTQYTEPEIRAAVEAADNWGTYVTVHAYTPRAIRQAVAAGVKCIKHGHLIDEPTAKLLADKGIWWSLQPFLDEHLLLVDGDPLENIKLIEDPDKNFLVIIKDGTIYKNTLLK